MTLGLRCEAPDPACDEAMSSLLHTGLSLCPNLTSLQLCWYRSDDGGVVGEGGVHRSTVKCLKDHMARGPNPKTSVLTGVVVSIRSLEGWSWAYVGYVEVFLIRDRTPTLSTRTPTSTLTPILTLTLTSLALTLKLALSPTPTVHQTPTLIVYPPFKRFTKPPERFEGLYRIRDFVHSLK